MGTAGGVSFFIGVGSDHVPTGTIVADVQLGVSAQRVEVESVSATHVRGLAPYKLKQTETSVRVK